MECSIASQLDNSSRPAMLLVTPYDLDGTAWTKEVPTFTILARLMHLSRKALAVAKESFLKNGTVENFKVIYLKYYNNKSNFHLNLFFFFSNSKYLGLC